MTAISQPPSYFSPRPAVQNPESEPALEPEMSSPSLRNAASKDALKSSIARPITAVQEKSTFPVVADRAVRNSSFSISQTDNHQRQRLTKNAAKTSHQAINKKELPIITAESIAALDAALCRQIELNGAGHVVWGSKPVWLLDTMPPESFELLCALEKRDGLKDNFVLMKCGPSSRNGNNGCLINRYNLKRLIEQSPEHFASLIQIHEKKKPSFTLKSLASYIAPHPADTDIDITSKVINLLKSDLNSPQKAEGLLLGAVFGYGINNSTRFMQVLSREIPPPPISNAMQFAHEIDGRPSGRNLLAIPGFAAWESAESNELIQRYINESIDIKEVFLKDALTSAEPIAAVGTAFRKNIFQDKER